MVSITYDSKKTTMDAVLKSIALSGSENSVFFVPDEAFKKLHGCCKPYLLNVCTSHLQAVNIHSPKRKSEIRF